MDSHYTFGILNHAMSTILVAFAVNMYTYHYCHHSGNYQNNENLNIEKITK